jgi:cell division septum initiation protein DivIVA
LEHVGTAELTARINELLAQVERLAVERDATAAHNARLQAALTDAENTLTANHQALKKMIKAANLEG